YLYVGFRGADSVFVFDATLLRSTVENPKYASDLDHIPIDELESDGPDPDALKNAIDVKANYTILPGANLAAGAFTFGVPKGATNGRIGTGGNTQGLAVVAYALKDLSPLDPTQSLNPTFRWQFTGPDSAVRKIELFVSVYPQGQGLLPEDRFGTLPEPFG